MTPQTADRLSAAELAALLHFYAEAGVDWLVEDSPIDRISEFADQQVRARPAPEVDTGRSAPPASSRPGTPQAVRGERTGPVLPSVSMPGETAVVEAEEAAMAAQSLETLHDAVQNFAGCNLRNSARSTAFLAGNLSASLLVIGGAAGEDDDREGAPFSGRPGAMLEKMLAGLGLGMDGVLLANVIPWRPPGNRQPTVREVEICLPFTRRLIALAKPQRILALGSLPLRVLSDRNDTFHALRGQWLDVGVAGDDPVKAIGTFHPTKLINAPLCKAIAWQDLLQFGRGPGV